MTKTGQTFGVRVVAAGLSRCLALAMAVPSKTQKGLEKIAQGRTSKRNAAKSQKKSAGCL